jgi:hypothetical protein
VRSVRSIHLFECFAAMVVVVVTVCTPRCSTEFDAACRPPLCHIRQARSSAKATSAQLQWRPSRDEPLSREGNSGPLGTWQSSSIDEANHTSTALWDSGCSVFRNAARHSRTMRDHDLVVLSRFTPIEYQHVRTTWFCSGSIGRDTALLGSVVPQ